jgi:putative resolvase
VRVTQRTVLANPGGSDASVGGVGLYARESSHDHGVDVDRRVARLSQWAAQANAPVVRAEAGVGCGMNGARRKVRRLLADVQSRRWWSIGIGWDG